MKKLLILLLAVLLLAGCSNSKAYSEPSNSNEVIFKTAGKEYTKGELYKALKVSSSSVIENDIITSIAKGYGVDLESIEKEADEIINSYVSIGYESMIIQYYGSVEAYRSTIISSSVVDALAKQLVTDQFEERVNEDNPIKLQMANFDTLENAKLFVEKVNGGASFEMALLEINPDANPEAYVYLDSDDVDILVKEYLNSTETTGLSTIITSSKLGTDGEGNDVPQDLFVVVNVISRNVEDFKEEYIEAASMNLETDDITDFFFNKHDIKFYDQDLYEIMTKEFEVLK